MTSIDVISFHQLMDDRVTHLCIDKRAIIGSDNDLSPVWCQAIV